MPEAILIVDDTPINRRLTKRVLTGAGYEARCVPTAEEALNILPQMKPRLVLTDLRLPGMDGLALARHIKQDPLTRQTVVVVLTGCNTPEDRAEALSAGCDDFITKPIDTRTFPAVIHAHLARQFEEATGDYAAGQFKPGELPCWAVDLCREFFRDGAIRVQQVLSLGAVERDDDLRGAAHLWAGLGTTLGYPEITVLARRLDELLRKPGSVDYPDLGPVLRRLAEIFSQPPIGSGRKPAESDLPGRLVEALSGKKFALVGFEGDNLARITATMHKAGVEVLGAEPASLSLCDLVIAPAVAQQAAALVEQFQSARSRPLLLVGAPCGDPQIALLLDRHAPDFATEAWTEEELLTRACRLVAAQPAGTGGTPEARARDGRVTVLVADDDPTTVTLLRTTIQNSGMDCVMASEGDQALAMIRSAPPDVALLDVMMPNMDGFEVIAAIRNDQRLNDLKVVLLTALQQETDVVRGFALGADDYVTKPFSPVEVVARIRRLVRSRL